MKEISDKSVKTIEQIILEIPAENMEENISINYGPKTFKVSIITFLLTFLLNISLNLIKTYI